MKYVKSLVVVWVIWILSGCGGGTSVAPTPLKLIDIPANGIAYVCGERHALTESQIVDGELRHGVAQCTKGTVTFSIGSLIIGNIEDYHEKQSFHFQDFFDIAADNFNDEELIKLAMLIISLDDDGDIDEKIDIDSSVDVTLTSLESMSISEVQTYILSLGKTPLSSESVQKYIIKRSELSYAENVLTSSPTLLPQSFSVSIDERVGNIIGTVTLDRGNGEFQGFELSGEGNESFKVLDSGEIRLMQALSDTTTYTLILKTSNEFGSASSELNITVTSQPKLIKINLGKLTNATIDIYRLLEDGSKEWIETTTSDDTANFDAKVETLDDSSYYIYQITGGVIQPLSIDLDNSGTLDGQSYENEGTLRLILRKEWIKNAAYPIQASALTEILYLYAVDTLNNHYSNIANKLDEIAQTLIGTSDLNGDDVTNVEDIIVFDPLTQQEELAMPLAKAYNPIAKGIILNDSNRSKDVFDTKVITAFDINGSGCGLHTLCSFEIEPHKIKYYADIVYTLDEDELLIFDAKAKETISYLQIPQGDYGIYLDTNRIFLSASDANIVTIDLSSLSQPTLVDTPLSNIKGYILGKIDDRVLISQDSELLIVDVNDISNAKEIKRYTTLPQFDYIDEENDEPIAYSFAIDNNQLNVEAYLLNDLSNISKVANYSLSEALSNNAQVYMYTQKSANKRLYILTPNSSLAMYEIVDSNITFKDSVVIDATKIININDEQLYAYGNRRIYEVETKNSSLTISNSFDFDQTTNQLYFANDQLYTPHYIINLNALMLSSPYITIDTTRAYNQEYSIDLETIKDPTIFDRF